MVKEKEILKGSKVFVDGFGMGLVESVSQGNSENGSYPVFHVRLESDEVRHFTTDQVELE